MTLIRVAIARIRALFRRDVIADEIRKELQFHIPMRADEYARNGIDPIYSASLSGRIQILRKRTGLPWSCKPIGPFAFDGAYGGFSLCAVGPKNASALCTSTPLCTTVTTAGVSSFSPLKRG